MSTELELRRGIVARWKIEPKEGDKFGVLFLERDPIPYAGGIGHGVEPGDEVAFLAKYAESPRYGGQYKVQRMTTHLPGKRNLVQWVLQRLPQIGPIRAKALEQRFGANIWEVIEGDHRQLCEVDGIGPERADEIKRMFLEERQSIAIYTSLLNLGVDPRILLSLLKRKVSAWELQQYVELDPYQLLRFAGLKFVDIDQLGKAREIDRFDPRRICGAVLHVLRDKQREGHTCVPYNIVRMEARGMLGVNSEHIDAGFAQVEQLPFPAHFAFFGKNVQWGDLAEADRQFARALGVDIGEPPVTVDLHRNSEAQIARDQEAADRELAANPQWYAEQSND